VARQGKERKAASQIDQEELGEIEKGGARLKSGGKLQNSHGKKGKGHGRVGKVGKRR